MSTKRVTAVQAEVEYGGSQVRRVTVIGIMVEYQPVLSTGRVQGPPAQMTG